jgi:hypothetical protein
MVGLFATASTVYVSVKAMPPRVLEGNMASCTGSSQNQNNNMGTVAAPLLANINKIADFPLPNGAVTGFP